MNNRVYKSEEGRRIVESAYREMLRKTGVLVDEELILPTEIAKTHVMRFGDKEKPPLMMIHGTASNSLTWLGCVENFTEAFCVYCVDIPGEPGLSDPFRFSLASEEPETWMESLLDKLGIRKASFLTMSLGSWYLINWAVKNPHRVTALSMLTTSGIVPAKRSFLIKAIFFMLLGKRGEALLNRTIYHHAEIPPEAASYQAIVSKHFIPVLEEIPLFSDDELGNLTFPVQYFGGDKDALIDSRKTGERLQRLLPDPVITILEDTGHVILDQFPEIKKFLDSHTA